MHRRITFQGDSGAIQALARDLKPVHGLIALAYHPGCSLEPPGDVLQVEVLNCAADEVLRRAHPRVQDAGIELSVIISQSTALVDRRRMDLIESDADEALWEEMETDLRNQGRISANYVLLMALGGVIAGTGFLLEPISQTIAFVGASVVAPGFEPLAKLTQGLVLRKMAVCGRALISLAVGYGVLLAAAFLVALGFAVFGDADVHAVVLKQPMVAQLTRLHAAPLVVSAGAAVAGFIMVVSLRDFYVIGALMLLVMISGVALIGVALAVREPGIALGALGRVGADVILILVLGALVFIWKQRQVHRRRPLA